MLGSYLQIRWMLAQSLPYSSQVMSSQQQPCSNCVLLPWAQSIDYSFEAPKDALLLKTPFLSTTHKGQNQLYPTAAAAMKVSVA